jgi:glycosyl transferase family 25
MKSISDIKHAFYINLYKRPDRKQHVENQLKTVGINAERFNAIEMQNGAIGCSTSHLTILETAKANNWDHVLIIEDDILFINPNLFVSQFNKFLSIHSYFDVALIAGNNVPPYTIIDDTCVQVMQCQTTTGYLVKSHYYDKLIENFKNGILNQINRPNARNLYAIDKYWFNLQQVDKWFLIIPLTVAQREDYSNIENRPTNYISAMLDLDKVAFFKRQKELIALRDIGNLNR